MLGKSSFISLKAGTKEPSFIKNLQPEILYFYFKYLKSFQHNITSFLFSFQFSFKQRKVTFQHMLVYKGLFSVIKNIHPDYWNYNITYERKQAHFQSCRLLSGLLRVIVSLWTKCFKNFCNILVKTYHDEYISGYVKRYLLFSSSHRMLG